MTAEQKAAKKTPRLTKFAMAQAKKEAKAKKAAK